MSVIVAFFVGICFATLADSIADYISACAKKIEATAESIRIENKAKKLALADNEKNETSEKPQE